jgi:hypothetical protein
MLKEGILEEKRKIKEEEEKLKLLRLEQERKI